MTVTLAALSSERCQATTDAGTRCQRLVHEGDGTLCRFHQWLLARREREPDPPGPLEEWSR